MRRREFIALVTSAAAANPAPARSQQSKPAIGYLFVPPMHIISHRLVAFRRGLEAEGFIDGRNCVIEYRSAEGRVDRLADLAADLIGRGAVLIAANGDASALAVKRLTATIPIVVVSANDMVELGLVASLNRPGGNVTGVNYLTGELIAKRLALLNELVPTAGKIAVLLAPESQGAGRQMQVIEEAGRKLNLQVRVDRPATLAELDAALDDIAIRKPDALLVGPGPIPDSGRQRIVAVAARGSLPAAYPARQFVEIGGLMSYGVHVSAAYYIAGEYAGRILKGERAADLPVQQSTRFELVLNLKTAKALGIEFPSTLLAIADEVIE